ncbi:GntR family transcriptional regulator [Prauserella halophila]|uniref:GntR family transcriptional regulator n=1 Tax=Prauserella halophila TaxID=185641 RepID=A0ABN1WLP8_9PSEU|nr:GntR family transcriptional regulator [Prauserella halophila]MCP2238130.1 transcriptional regulator, GntR family [Prauserella halophila]
MHSESVAPESPPESRRDWLVRQIRNRIASGDLAAGDRLVERDLSAVYDLSRGPVREAIMVLEHEGLVVTKPYRGAVVADIEQAEITETLVPIRLIIERAAFRAVAQSRPEALLEKLHGIVARMERASDARLDVAGIADLDVEFHESVISAAGHAQSLQIWKTIQPRVRAYFLRDAPQHESPRAIVEQHRLLLDALVEGHSEQVDEVVVQHIQTYLTDTD